MRDEHLWKVPPLLARAVPQRQSLWFMQLIVPVVTAAVVATLVVVGINGLRDATPLPPAVVTPSPTQTPSASPTPTPTSTITTTGNDQTPPAQNFGGDCAAILSDAEASDLAGAPLKLSSNSDKVLIGDGVSDSLFVIRENAGISCVWTTDDWFDHGIQLVVFAEDAVPDIAESTCGEGHSESTAVENYCKIEIVVNGYRLSGGVYGTTQASAKTLSAAVISRFRQLSAGTAPIGPPRNNGEWAAIQSCDAIGGTLDLEGILGTGSTFGTTGLGAGNGSNEAVNSLLFDMGLWTRCGAQEGSDLDDDDVVRFGSVGIYGGGAWALNELVAGGRRATEVQVDGFDRVIVDDQKGITYFFVGSNMLTFSGARFSSVEGKVYPLMRAVVASLDAE